MTRGNILVVDDEEHGGTITVQSEVGVGTTFRIALSAPEPSASQSTPPSALATR